MSLIKINGGRKIDGSVKIQGAKNAVLPIMAAAVLNRGESVIHNCPHLSDVSAAGEILKAIGCRVERSGDTLVIDSSGADNYVISDELMLKMRSSVIFCGSLVSLFGAAEISRPGGCEIGARPVDLHLKAFRDMGIDVSESHGRIICSGKPKGAKIHLDVPSVGATENIMLAACLASGETVINNAAKEPEICDLAAFLNSMGARICGAGESVVKIDGVRELSGTEFTVMPDRIAAATYMAATAAAGGRAELSGIVYPHVEAIASPLADCGCEFYEDGTNLFVRSPGRLRAASRISTGPYPGFPTDAQAVVMAALSTARGTSVMTENIFESRWGHVPELLRMGADISVSDRTAVVRGREKLLGARVSCTDLRGGAALCVAALAASGESEIDKLCHIDRGYEDIVRDLCELGADIKREDD